MFEFLTHGCFPLKDPKIKVAQHHKLPILPRHNIAIIEEYISAMELRVTKALKEEDSRTLTP